METVSCNLCGSDQYQLVYQQPDWKYFPEEIFSVVECTQCGLAFVNPRPCLEEMNRYYPSEYYNYFEEDILFQEKRYQIEAEYIEKYFSVSGEKARLLDIGCANGGFPRFMKAKGWEVEGVEVSKTSRPIEDFLAYNLPFPEIPINSPRYDVITAWAVLEHVHDPRAYFQKSAILLKPGGFFVFLVTNYKSISSHCLFLEDIPRHLYFYSENTIQKYLRDSGFVLKKCYYNNRVFSMKPVNWLFFLNRRVKGKKFLWTDLPENFFQYRERFKDRSKVKTIIRYILENPLILFDRTMIPVIEIYQRLMKSYGIVIFISQKE